VIPSSQELPVVNQKVIRYELYCPATTQYVLLMRAIPRGRFAGKPRMVERPSTRRHNSSRT